VILLIQLINFILICVGLNSLSSDVVLSINFFLSIYLMIDFCRIFFLLIDAMGGRPGTSPSGLRASSTQYVPFSVSGRLACLIAHLSIRTALP
jgi:hypothetical protein